MAKKKLTPAEVKAAADRAQKRSDDKKKGARPAKKKAADKAPPEPAPEPERPYTSARMISQNDLRNLIKSIKIIEGDKDEASELISKKIKDAATKKNLDKKAFALIRRFDKMENEKLAAFWDNLEAYMDMAGLYERIESVGKLPLGDTVVREQPSDSEPKPGESGEEPAPPAAAVPKKGDGLTGDNIAKLDFGKPREAASA